VKRLSGADSFFLYAEGPTWTMHTGALVILQPPEGRAFGLEHVRATLASRLHRVPEFTMTVRQVPLDLDRPLLVEDPNFNLDLHLHRVGLPRPGGDQELGDLIGDLVATPLDRRRALWELWFIDGLSDGRVALFAKVHHALIDGVSGAGIAELLCDLEPNPAPDESTPPPAVPERAPHDLELLARGALSAARDPLRTAAWALEASQRLIKSVRTARPVGGRTALDQAPKVPWVGVLGPLRRFAFCSVPLDDIKQVKQAHDVKVNDVVLATVSGALRRWLNTRDALPRESLVATVPMSLRSHDDMELGNKLTPLYASLATDVEDPVQRLKQIAANMRAAKEVGEALRASDIRTLSASVTPGLANLAFRMLERTRAEAWLPMPSNLVVSNIPGAPIPLYMAGARITAIHPVPPVTVSQGLNVTVMSYLDSVDFGFVVDRERIGDPWELTSHIRSALDELLESKRPRQRRKVD
jgi:WS/DGAT/MGAT family acyltransferase